MIEAGGVYLRLSVDQVRLVPHVLVLVLLRAEPVHCEANLHTWSHSTVFLGRLCMYALATYRPQLQCDRTQMVNEQQIPLQRRLSSGRILLVVIVKEVEDLKNSKSDSIWHMNGLLTKVHHSSAGMEAFSRWKCFGGMHLTALGEHRHAESARSHRIQARLS